MDPLEMILKVSAETDPTLLKQRVSQLALHYGYDRSILFSVAPLREPFIDRIFWIDGRWPEGSHFDEQTYIERCPVNHHLLASSRPFFWRKMAGKQAADEYQIVDKPLKGALHGIQIPVFGHHGIEGALSLGGLNIDTTPEARLVVETLAGVAFRRARYLSGAETQEQHTSLTPRETQILRLVSQGLKQTAIARVLEISPRTVENHLRQIRQRLGVYTTAQAVQVTLQSGALQRNDPA